MRKLLMALVLVVAFASVATGVTWGQEPYFIVFGARGSGVMFIADNPLTYSQCQRIAERVKVKDASYVAGCETKTNIMNYLRTEWNPQVIRIVVGHYNADGSWVILRDSDQNQAPDLTRYI